MREMYHLSMVIIILESPVMIRAPLGPVKEIVNVEELEMNLFRGSCSPWPTERLVKLKVCPCPTEEDPH